MAKRRLISLLPSWSQTEELTNFFGTSVDELFNPGISDNLSEYIGRKPSFFNPATDFYISEPTASRANYQLEAGMVSIDANTQSITSALTYPDFINALMTAGSNIFDHSRLFENEYYSWAPPINIDMLSNYREYLWFGDESGDGDLPTLTLTVPMNFFLGDGVTTTFALPGSINAVATANELPTVFVDNLQVVAIVVGSNMVCESGAPPQNIYNTNTTVASGVTLHFASTTGVVEGQAVSGTHVAPGTIVSTYTPTSVTLSIAITGSITSGTPITFQSQVLVTRVPSLAAKMIGKTTVDISDINIEGVLTLTSTMRIKIIDASVITGSWDAQPWDSNLWDLSGSGRYMVDGVGMGIRLTPDEYMIRTTKAQYITIDRSSFEGNLWSFHNSWVHKDSITWASGDFSSRQAVRPIIEFIRDIVLYPNQIWSESTEPLFMLYDINNYALDDTIEYPLSDFTGNRIFGYVHGVSIVDPVLNFQLAFDNNGYIQFNNDAYSIRYHSGTSVTEIKSLYCYGTYDGTDHLYHSMWHEAFLPSTQEVNIELFYDVPLNLQANPSSLDVTLISRSTWLDHFQSIIANQTGFVGQALGDNNYRDSLRDLTLGTSILQHRAPLLKAMLTSAVTDFDVPSSIRYAENEYNKFRNKFIRKLTDIDHRGLLQGIDPTIDPTTWVTTALFELTRDKNNSFPFALSNMAGGKYFIPPTPASLGVLPAVIPALITDDTIYSTSQTLIRGHDGSLTPLFGDWRDNVLLELEMLIYNNISSLFQTESRPSFDIKSWIGGHFITPVFGYTFNEVTEILGPMFEIWVQTNRLDYRSNPDYDEANPFTWNFNGVKDIFGYSLPGNWRAIYRYYYDTDAPHIRPWEMLGFEYEPTWWNGVYGSAPYARSNAMWADLETGTIVGGTRIGVDQRYARLGLSDLIPVDNSGNLLDPVGVGIVTTNVPISVSSRSWQAGDQSPVENLWYNSPSYRYGLALAAFLMKPVRFMEECWDINIGFIGSQWVVLNPDMFDYLSRPLNKDQYIHGETRPDLTVAVVTGVQQWIVDYLASKGKNSTEFGNAIRGLDVRLMHQMAGFVSSDEIKVVADNFGLLPSEDVNVTLYTSPSNDVEVYSGCILQWTGTGWRAIGYDARNPWFTIIPPDTSGPKGLISLATAAEPAILPWRSNTYYPTSILIAYQNSVYQCIRSHTSGPTFEPTFWLARPDLATSMIRAPRVVTYGRGLSNTTQIPYGTEFNSYQDIADFLLGWQRYLVSRGWIFDSVDSTTGVILNWELSIKEFLTWAQIQWQPGNFIALSPGMQGLKFSTTDGTVLNVEDNITGFFGLLDRSGKPIKDRDATINRLDGQITLTATNADIFSARLEIAEIEHLLVMDNVTIFNDNVYLPLFNMRQDRLLLICNRSSDWAGRLDAPGFMVIGNTLKSNFEKSANDVRLMFDIELADNKELRDYARHVIGFQERDYLNNLLLSDSEQFEFYQGMIQQKGAPGVFSKLMRSQRASSNSDLKFLEEWAFRMGQYGAPIDPFIILQITQTDTRTDPQIIRFVTTPNAPLTWINMPLSDAKWLDKPAISDFFQYRTTPNTLPTAGPVRLNDVTYTAFHGTDVPSLYQGDVDVGIVPFAVGTRTWVYERDDGTYTVLESFDTGSTPNTIIQVLTKNEDISIVNTRIVFVNTMNLTTDDIGNYVVFDGQSKSDPELQGVQKISAVNVGGNYIEVSLLGITGHDFTSELSLSPVVRVLREMRFTNPSALASASYLFPTNDLAWIDNYSDGRWAVVQWNGSAWVVARNQPDPIDSGVISETVMYNENIKISNSQMFVHDPIVPVLDVIDPLVGLISGTSEKEIDFKLAFDPAHYDDSGIWGDEQIGKVWWDISKVKFLDPYTDIIGTTNIRDLNELAYRASVWGTIAPNSYVEVYEWTKGTVAPKDYAGTGTPLQIVDSSGITTYNWVENLEFEPATQKTTLYFYFWIKGLDVKPDIDFRTTDITTVTNGIINPSGIGTPWLAPINTDALIFSSVIQFLNDTDSVLKVRMTLDIDNQNHHDEWLLLRPTDETTLPNDIMWTILRVSLAGFNETLQVLPYANLAPTRRVGIFAHQNMFDVTGTGLQDARHAFVQSINNIFSATAISIERQIYINTIFRSTPINQYLTWTQIDTSYPFEEPPPNEFDITVYTLEERNKLVARPDFLAAITSVTTIRVLLNSYGNPTPLKSWSIWDFNPVNAAFIIAANPMLDSGLALLLNIEDPVHPVFTLALSYDHMVPSSVARDALVTPLPTISVGDRVFVEADETAVGFWTIWKYDPSNLDADAKGFVLWRVQTYRTDDFISSTDWYDTGYSADNPPIITYDTLLDRNNAETTSFANTFVKINDDSTGKWIWTVLEKVIGLNGPIAIPEVDDGIPNDSISTVWKTVAIQNGTAELSAQFYNPNTVTHSVTSTEITDIENRDGAWELYILVQALRYAGLLLESEINTVWFDIINFCYTQQADVDWAFKTSFMSIVGYNVPLEETPFVIPDQTDNLLSYVNEVKPYRVKIREFSTQYSTDIDDANAIVTDFDNPVYFDPVFHVYRTLDLTSPADLLVFATRPWSFWYDNYIANPGLIRGLDITIAFDRFASEFDAWDDDPWASTSWDDNEELDSNTYVHTFVNASLITPGNTVSVDDVTYLQPIKVTDINTLTINLGINSYTIINIIQDDINISTTIHGTSGTITTSGTFSTADATANNIVEAIIPTPSAASRIEAYYTPGSDMPPNDLILLMNLDLPSTTIDYLTSVNVADGATVLTFSSTIGIFVDQRIAAPNIVQGTFVHDVTSTTVTLSQPTIGPILSGTSIVFDLTNWIDGYQLHDLNSPSDFDTVAFDSAGLDVVVSNFNDVVFDGGMFHNATITVNVGATVLTFLNTIGIQVGQTVSGPNIDEGTLVQIVTGTTVTLSLPIVGTISSGSAITFNSFPGFDINPKLVSRTTNSMRDPYFAPNHPEERLPFAADDGLQLTVTANANAGGPPQIIKEFNVFDIVTSTTTLFYDLISQSNNAVMVFRDGVRAILNTDYTVDYFNRTVTVNVHNVLATTATAAFGITVLHFASTTKVVIGQTVQGTNIHSDTTVISVTPTTVTLSVGVTGGGITLGESITFRTEFVQIHAFGFGGTSVSDEQHFIAFSANPFVLDNASSLANVMVVESGIILGGGSVAVSGDMVSLTSPPSVDTDVAIVVFEGGKSTASIMTTQTLAYNGGQTWTLTPNDTDTVPEHAGTIVEVNGLRLAPLKTFYGTFTSDTEWMFLPYAPDNTTTVTVYIDGVLYAHTIPFCDAIDPSTSTFPFFIDGTTFTLPPVVPGRFVIFNNNLLVALDPIFAGNVTIVLDFPLAPPDYTVISGVLTINPTLASTDFIQATTFSNAASMGLETVVYDVGSVEEYFVPIPFAKDYCLVNMDGKALSPDVDYEIFDGDIGWDSINFDDVPYDLSFPIGILNVFAPTAGQIEATICTAPAAREHMEWQIINHGPAYDRMPPDKNPDGSQMFVTKYSKVWPTRKIEFDYFRRSPYMAGSLTNQLLSTDNNIVITLFLKELAPKLQEPNPIAQPEPNRPGVIWIGSERIEYFTYARSGDTVTLTGLRRATHGTAIMEQRLLSTGTGNGGSQVYVLDATNGTGPIEVKIDGEPSASYSSAIVGSSLQVTLTAPVGTYVTVAMSIGYTYLVGTPVYNGEEPISTAPPIGISVGDREISPVHEIIVR